MMKRKNLQVFLISFLFLSFLCHGQQETPYNSNHLIEFGITPKVLDIAVLPFKQGLGFKTSIAITETINGKTKQIKFILLYDPYEEFGLDLQVVIPEDNSVSKREKRGYKKLIESLHKESRQAADIQFFDEDSIHVLENQNDRVVIGFRFRQKGLPPPNATLKYFQGKVFVKEGILDRIELSNTEPFKYQGIDIQKQTDIAYFSKVPQAGGYLYDSYRQEIEGSRKGRPYQKRMESQVLEYFDENGQSIEWKPGVLETKTPALEGETIRVKLDFPLPIFGRQARKLGYDIPLPFGVELFSHHQNEDMGFENIMINKEDLTSLVNTENSLVKTTAAITSIRADIWIFPFLNLTGIFGRGLTDTQVTLALSEEFKQLIKDYGWIGGLEPGEVPDSIKIHDSLDTVMYGGGGTLAWGYKNIFGTVNAMYITSSVKEAGTSVIAKVISPLIGYRFPFINIMAGAQYQDYDKRVKGTVDLGQEKLEYDVGITAIRWNYILGLQKEFSKKWNFSLQLGFGKRISTTFTFGYRL